MDVLLENIANQIPALIKGQKLKLCPFEQQVVWNYAKALQRATAGQQDFAAKIENQLRTNTMSFGAEMAFCRMANIFPRFELYPGQWDCVAPDGRLIDVKHAEEHHKNLICRVGSNSAAELFVLMTGEFPEFTYRGMATRAELHEEIMEGNYGKPAYFRHQDKLHDNLLG